MKKLFEIIWAVLLYLWQLPQNFIGLAYLAYCCDRVKIIKQRGAVFYATKRIRGGVTLGRYIFISPANIDREPVFDHEFGHVRQSRILGPLWLFVVAIPSGLHCLFCRAVNYYHFYPESWANRLGGVPNYAGEYHYHMDGFIVTCWDKLLAIKRKYL